VEMVINLRDPSKIVFLDQLIISREITVHGDNSLNIRQLFQIKVYDLNKVYILCCVARYANVLYQDPFL
jgi:hypothetical protein